MVEIRIYKSPWKAIKFLSLTILPVIGGVFIIINEPIISINWYMGWLMTTFFGLGIPIGLFQMFDRRTQIIINEEGLWDRTTNQNLIKWESIKNVYPFVVNGQKFISLVLDKDLEVKVKQYKWASWLSKNAGAQKVNMHVSPMKVDFSKLMTLIKKIIKSTNIEEKRKAIKNFSKH